MQTSLKGIAEKARKERRHRFQNLSGLLTKANLSWCWMKLNKHSAVGVDRVSYQEYEENLDRNIEGLIERLKKGSYHAKLVRRHYIPKSNGKLRPLGIPATEDKMLQYAAAQILQAIYEQDFLPSSYGYRKHVGAKDAVKFLQGELNFGPYKYVVEADIKGFFDNIDHDWLIKMLELRIDDRRFLRLIRKWLKAGVLDTDGKVIHPATGTPQGGIVSPVLANIYMHYTLNLWFEKDVKKTRHGKAYLWVYADDFVGAFECKEDAERYLGALGKRLKKFGLEVAEEKTNLIQFSRHGGKENGTFEFLGFEFRWVKSRKKKVWYVKPSTSRKKMRNSIRTFTEWCKENRSKRVDSWFKEVNAKLRGYYNYYGVPVNADRLYYYHRIIREIMFKWLNRRSHRKSYTWIGFEQLEKQFGLVKPSSVYGG